MNHWLIFAGAFVGGFGVGATGMCIYLTYLHLAEKP